MTRSRSRPTRKYYLAPDARVHLWVGRGQGLAFAALLLLAAPAADNAWADPEHMLVPGQYDPLEVLPPPPAPGSPKAAAEIAELKRTQAAATPAQMAAAAYDDAHEDGTIFAAALGPGYDMARLPATATLLHVVIRNEAHLSASAKAASTATGPGSSIPRSTPAPRMATAPPPTPIPAATVRSAMPWRRCWRR